MMNHMQKEKVTSSTRLSEEEMCIVCSEKKEAGLYIWGHFICRQCEEEMVETEVEDHKYRFFIEQMRKIWLKETDQH